MPPSQLPTSRDAPAFSAPSADRIAALRNRIGALPASGHGAAGAATGLGIAEIDALLPAAAPRPAGLHELKPVTAADVPVLRAFALAVLARRAAADQRPVLWVTPQHGIQEYGDLYAPGLAALGLPPHRCLIATPRTSADTLWVVEEALKAGTVAAVAGQIDALDITPARRLVLAASVPCLMLSSARSPPTPVAHTRWRLARHPIAGSDFVRWRCRLWLERCRHGPIPLATAEASSCGWTLEWCDASNGFCVAAAMADRAVTAGGTLRTVCGRN